MNPTALRDFLRTRYREQDRVLRRARPLRGSDHGRFHPFDVVGTFSLGCPACIADWPGRDYALTDIRVKQMMLDEHAPMEWVGSDRTAQMVCARCARFGQPVPYPCATVRLLGQQFAQHPLYRPEWSL